MAKDRGSANLDFLRASAVLFVYFAHLLQSFHIEWLGGRIRVNDFGQTGVLIFFVHTCLVLMYSMDRLQPTTRHLFGAFYIRRFFRIYPLSVVTIVAMLSFRIPEFTTSQYQWIGWRALVSNLALSQNLTQTVSYPRVLWSLPLEVQMYLVLPCLFLLVRRFPSVWTPEVLWLADALFIGLLWRLNAQWLAGLLEFSPCFLGGLIAYRMSSVRRRPWPVWGWPLAILLCVGLRICAQTFYFHGLVRASGWVACLGLGFLIPQFRELGKGIVSTISGQIAKYSYGIYLSHTSALWVSFVVLRDSPAPIKWACCIVMSAALPFLLFHAVEKPMISLGVRLAAGVAGSAKGEKPESSLGTPGLELAPPETRRRPGS